MQPDSSLDPVQLRRLLQQQLESLRRAGLTHLPRGVAEALTAVVTPMAPAKPAPVSKPAEIAKPVEPPRPAPMSPSPSVVPAISPPVPVAKATAKPAGSLFEPTSPLSKTTAQAPMTVSQRSASLQVLRDEVAGCTRCPALVANRTQTVFGVGNIKTRLVFFGEAPGADEDRVGEPFVGRAGQLLDKMIAACTLTRQSIYIMNVLKCRPPGNRAPLPDEVSNCRGFFERQLEILQPEFICCLGASASQALLQTTTPIGKLRGKFHNYRGAQVLCTFHPAYLLRNPPAKRDAWDDLKLLMTEMGIDWQAGGGTGMGG